ncbi:hypothetical protein [Paraburkholderia acidisoli]|uniref:Uncharacterized protein n=1 Tax=Paraburkholderia acidisoli TaxID=2571748 RepID=A0A7Z2JIF2_9BURK|nr:hypothetical protein [Paraburkholderia acidisoli]QGZ65646.1 hypothetical protein FAZ98_28315 [Paraburkholderia acidisoli]
MKRIKPLFHALACAATLASPAVFAAPPDAGYDTSIQLSGGKTLRCGVNEAPPPGHAAVLTRREQNEADVLATQRLRLLTGPASPWPSAETAPSVACVDAS